MTAKIRISDFLAKNIKINYKNSGLAVLDISVLQKYTFLSQKAAARVDSFTKMTGTAGFLIGPIYVLGLFRQHPADSPRTFRGRSVEIPFTMFFEGRPLI